MFCNHIRDTCFLTPHIPGYREDLRGDSQCVVDILDGPILGADLGCRCDIWR